MQTSGPATRRVLLVIDWGLRIVGAFSLFAFALMLYDEFRFSKLEPPPEVKDIRGFRAWRPDLDQARKMEIRGSIYYAIRGPFARSLPSAHSEYYFDSLGNYFGRNIDPGDFKRPALFFSPDVRSSKISVEEIPVKSHQ